MKEADASQTSVLNDLFLPMPKKRVKDLGLTEEEESRYVLRLSREVEACGAMDRIAIGASRSPVERNIPLLTNHRMFRTLCLTKEA